MRKILKTLRKVLLIFLIVIAILFSGLRFAGFTPYNVETKSMEPNFPPGTLLYVKETEFNNINVDDVITYINEGGSTVTHRVVSIDQNSKSVRTKGDANQYEDIMPVYQENIIGKVYFKIPYIGKISETITELYNSLISKGDTHE